MKTISVRVLIHGLVRSNIPNYRSPFYSPVTEPIVRIYKVVMM